MSAEHSARVLPAVTGVSLVAHLGIALALGALPQPAAGAAMPRNDEELSFFVLAPEPEADEPEATEPEPAEPEPAEPEPTEPEPTEPEPLPPPRPARVAEEPEPSPATPQPTEAPEPEPTPPTPQPASDDAESGSPAGASVAEGLRAGEGAGLNVGRSGASSSSGRVGASGNGRGQGTGDGAGDVDAPVVDRRALARAWVRRINRSLGRPSYPRSLVRARLEGSVAVALRIDPAGNVVEVRVRRSSGNELVDAAALEHARTLAQVEPPPEALNWRTREITLPITYRLPT